MIITHPKSVSSFFQVNCYCQLSSQGLPTRSRFHLLLLYWENSSHQEWTFSTSFPSTCTLIYSHTHHFLTPLLSQRNECPHSLPRRPFQHACTPDPGCFIFFWNLTSLVILSSTFGHFLSTILNQNISSSHHYTQKIFLHRQMCTHTHSTWCPAFSTPILSSPLIC